MPVLKIRTIDEFPELRRPSRAVTAFNQELRDLVLDMKATLRSTENGVGLAAPQVGVHKRVFVVSLNDKEPPMVFVNPLLSKVKGTTAFTEECLSIPGFKAPVTRPKMLTVIAQRIDGVSFRLKFRGFMARVICHEYDHLDGILIDDLEGRKTLPWVGAKV